jgi:UDP:flavonoid glycosyltransferase YjiC (YdhE family)
MDRLMGRADVSVHHGGWGSTVAALATGTPSVVVPIGADQFGNAQALRNTGSGVPIQRDRVSEDMADVIRSLLAEDIYALNARRLRAEIDAMPSAAECVRLVEQLAGDGVVFNKPSS